MAPTRANPMIKITIRPSQIKLAFISFLSFSVDNAFTVSSPLGAIPHGNRARDYVQLHAYQMVIRLNPRPTTIRNLSYNDGYVGKPTALKRKKKAATIICTQR